MGFIETFRDQRTRPALYLITDRNLCPDGLVAAVKDAVRAGVRFVQLREKDLGGRALLRLAVELRAVTGEYGAGLIINDRVDVVLASGADGVHLGRSSMSPGDARALLGIARLIGVSAHSVAEASDARDDGADFITFGPVYHTRSKAGYGPPVGLALLSEAARSVDIPVYGLGGIDAARVREVMGAGVAGVAAISAVLGGVDVAGRTGALVKGIEDSTNNEETK